MADEDPFDMNFAEFHVKGFTCGVDDISILFKQKPTRQEVKGEYCGVRDAHRREENAWYIFTDRKNKSLDAVGHIRELLLLLEGSEEAMRNLPPGARTGVVLHCYVERERVDETMPADVIAQLAKLNLSLRVEVVQMSWDHMQWKCRRFDEIVAADGEDEP